MSPDTFTFGNPVTVREVTVQVGPCSCWTCRRSRQDGLPAVRCVQGLSITGTGIPGRQRW